MLERSARAKRTTVAGAPKGARSEAELRLEELDRVMTALAHAARRHVLLVLRFRGGSMTAGEIASRFECSWPTTTRHLGVLVDAGLVRVRKRGRERIYELDAPALDRVVRGFLRWFRDEAASAPG
uniref:metalloregulator ArsR/SmtB family transcription factor n=1 Tax=Sandaracinus sp. TaxID=2024858 RepID=UPI0019D4D11F|nr:metalloregulator ArsR/SmtB family transcription factor [Sandaracinus sp.]